MNLGFLVVPLIGLSVVIMLIVWLPAIIKLLGLAKYMNETAQSLVKALLFSWALLFTIYRLLLLFFNQL